MYFCVTLWVNCSDDFLGFPPNLTFLTQRANRCLNNIRVKSHCGKYLCSCTNAECRSLMTCCFYEYWSAVASIIHVKLIRTEDYLPVWGAYRFVVAPLIRYRLSSSGTGVKNSKKSGSTPKEIALLIAGVSMATAISQVLVTIVT